MDPFNIVIRIDGAQIDLNIHPQQDGRYKIIYHGALLGEIFIKHDRINWEATPANELQPGGYPVYEYDESSGHEYILLDDKIVQEIGRQIINAGLR